jgi:tetratricopeptide (TPR) repeat protein
LGRGNALRQLLRHDEALAAYNRALLLEPDNPQTLCSIGVVLMDVDRLDEAEAKLRRAIKVDPNFAAAYNNLGLILKERGRLGDARFAIERAIRLSPNNTSYYDNLARCDPLRPMTATSRRWRAWPRTPQCFAQKTACIYILLWPRRGQWPL